MFGCRVRPRVWTGNMRRNRAVVDDPAALRRLSFHQPKRFLVAEKRAAQVSLNHPLPLLVRDILKLGGGNTGSGVIEQNVQATECSFRLSKQISDRSRISHIS